MITFHTSNRTETLAAELARTLRERPLPPMRQEMVVVQTRGMARWLSQTLADHNGVAMNIDYPFPKKVVFSILGRFFEAELEAFRAFEPELLAWRIMAVLPRLSGQLAFRPVNDNLEGADDLRRFRFCEQVAGLFDQYLVYRPDVVTAWQRGESEFEWQGELWRALWRESGKPRHWAGLLEELAERAAADRDQLPERMSIFGVSSLPPVFLSFFKALSQVVEVNFFHLQPTDQFWGDMITPEIALERLKTGELSEDEREFFVGNPLLAAWGKQGRDFLNLAVDADIYNDESNFSEAEGQTLLEAMQGDVLELQDRAGAGGTPFEVPPEDDSLQIHICHSPMREVEVLHDHLLAFFEEDPDLRPRDILVLVPDIERHAPYIHAVFSSPEEEEMTIPYSVADRAPRSEQPMADAFLSLLELPSTRFTSLEVLSLLEREPIREARGFSLKELEDIRNWIGSSAIFWGLDEEHREEWNATGFHRHSWRDGRRRMLLGYAVGDQPELFDGLAPSIVPTGEQAETLGRLSRFVGILRWTYATLRKPRKPSEWVEPLLGIVERFLPATEEAAVEVAPLRHAIFALGRVEEAVPEEPMVDHHAIQRALLTSLGERSGGGDFLARGVTFCAFTPMRSIPAKIVCLLGMEEGAFPRRQHPPSFDLMVKDPRPGDSNVRDNDRYLFLETLLSARRRLYISYAGRSVRDNQPIPPSVLLSDLLDYLDGAARFPDGGDARANLVREHPLQAYSPDYFVSTDTPRRRGTLFSYSKACLGAARELAESTPTAPPFFTGSLDEPNSEYRQLSLDALIRFFKNPSRTFAQERLGLRLLRDQGSLAEEEPIELNSLNQYQLRQRMFDSIERGQPEEGLREHLEARGEVPPGNFGRAEFGHRMQEVREIVSACDGLRDTGATLAVNIELHLSPFVLRGAVPSVCKDPHGALTAVMPLFGSGTLHGGHIIESWINLLALACESGWNAVAAIVTKKGTKRYASPEDPRGELEALLEIYWEGLRRPLPFFPKAGYAFAECLFKEEPLKAAVSSADGQWAGGWSGAPEERRDEYFSLFFENISFEHDEDFKRLSTAIFVPALAAEEEKKKAKNSRKR